MEATRTTHKSTEENLTTSQDVSNGSSNETKLSETIENNISNTTDDAKSNVNSGFNKSQAETSSTEAPSDQQWDPQNIRYEGDIAIYKDSNSGYEYQWDNNKNEWVARHNVGNYSFEDDTHVYIDTDGTKLFWDKEKKAWFPKLDDDFMAIYQMSYGFTEQSQNPDATTQKPAELVPEQSSKAKPEKGEKRKASEPTWFEVDEKQNTNVYVSNLPLDIEEQEFVDLMQKCGLVMRDPVTSKFKVKLYKEPGTNFLKGDALCTYIKTESVDLALNLLDGYDYKKHKIKVEKAKFQLKGEYDPKLKPKMRKKKEKLKIKKQQERLFDWRPEKKEGEKSKHERVVIVKNLFDPSIFDKDVSLILEFQQDLREEAGKIGEVRKVLLYDRHPEGVAQINMASPEEAEQVVAVLNGRWFMKRQLTAAIWDGKTKYKIAETDSQINQRLEGWDKFLEGEDETEANKTSSDTSKLAETDDKTSDEVC